MLLTRTPFGPHSTASVRVISSTPPFEALYGRVLRVPTCPATGARESFSHCAPEPAARPGHHHHGPRQIECRRRARLVGAHRSVFYVGRLEAWIRRGAFWLVGLFTATVHRGTENRESYS